MLFIVATPIGHLGDFSPRAQETLKLVDYILCEDTRTSSVLLKRFEIAKPLKSFHKFNESKTEASILQDLKNGKSIALISDAGTPGISDPGEQLIKQAIEAGIKITHIPGPSALITALVLSGLPSSPFQFVGFLPKKLGEYKKSLEGYLTYPGTTILYESPHRLVTLLNHLPPQRPLVIARELTKKFEEILRGSAEELLQHFKSVEPLGEFVILIGAGSDKPLPPLTLQQFYDQLIAEGTYKQKAIRAVSQKFRISKKEVESILADRLNLIT